MTDKIYGATTDEWNAAAKLCLPDLFPCVSNPNLFSKPTKDEPESVQIRDRYAKRPSKVHHDGLVMGLTWKNSNRVTDAELVRDWSSNVNNGFGFICRTIKAIDIDIDDQERADRMDAWICQFFEDAGCPIDPPQRTRPNSGRRVLLYRISDQSGPNTKCIVKLKGEGEAVEFLHDGQFVVAAGMHKSGVRYEWPDGFPESLEQIPALTQDQMVTLIRTLQVEWGVDGVATYDPHKNNGEFSERDDTQVDHNHPTYRFIVESDYFIKHLDNGMIAVRCPWEDSHSTPRKDPTETVVFPIGLGGEHSKLGFQCMHASHGPKTGADFLKAIGYSVGEEFLPVEDIPPAADTRPAFIRLTSSGGIPPNETNLDYGLKWKEGIGFDIRYDEFQGDVLIRPYPGGSWRGFQDTDYVYLCKALLDVGFMSIPDNKLRAGVAFAAKERHMDIAYEWLTSLRWDGRDRISFMHRDVLGTYDGAYPQAVMNYMWTAMAGRVLSPGIKADMIPVLVGRQGVRKSSFVHALAPSENWSVDIDLNNRDADTSRHLRGKVIAELAELRGLGSRDEDSIKAWITRTHEEWVPKFKEFATKYPRRFVMVGTNNRKRFLSDATGDRRWLPLTVCQTNSVIDVDWVKNNIEQLWAQAAAMYTANGILWQDAERLAREEHRQYTRPNLTTLTIERWIHDTGLDSFTTHTVAERCLRLDLRSSNTMQQMYNIESALISLGYEDKKGKWCLPFL